MGRRIASAQALPSDFLARIGSAELETKSQAGQMVGTSPRFLWGSLADARRHWNSKAQATGTKGRRLFSKFVGEHCIRHRAEQTQLFLRPRLQPRIQNRQPQLAAHPLHALQSPAQFFRDFRVGQLPQQLDSLGRPRTALCIELRYSEKGTLSSDSSSSPAESNGDLFIGNLPQPPLFLLRVRSAFMVPLWNPKLGPTQLHRQARTSQPRRDFLIRCRTEQPVFFGGTGIRQDARSSRYSEVPPPQPNRIHRTADLLSHRFVGRRPQQLFLTSRPGAVREFRDADAKLPALVFNGLPGPPEPDRDFRNGEFLEQRIICGSPRLLWRSPLRDAKFASLTPYPANSASNPCGDLVVGRCPQQLDLLWGPWPGFRVERQDAQLGSSGHHRSPGPVQTFGCLGIRNAAEKRFLLPRPSSEFAHDVRRF